MLTHLFNASNLIKVVISDFFVFIRLTKIIVSGVGLYLHPDFTISIVRVTHESNGASIIQVIHLFCFNYFLTLIKNIIHCVQFKRISLL